MHRGVSGMPGEGSRTITVQSITEDGSWGRFRSECEEPRAFLHLKPLQCGYRGVYRHRRFLVVAIPSAHDEWMPSSDLHAQSKVEPGDACETQGSS